MDKCQWNGGPQLIPQAPCLALTQPERITLECLSESEGTDMKQ